MFGANRLHNSLHVQNRTYMLKIVFDSDEERTMLFNKLGFLLRVTRYLRSKGVH